MAQVTIYLDDQIAMRVERQARKEGLSVSRWIRTRLDSTLDAQWPPGYTRLFGQLAKTNLERPAQPRSTAKGKRDVL